MKIHRGELNLYVTNVDRAAAFYRAALGFEECEVGEERKWVKLSSGDVTLLLFRAVAGEAAPPGTVPGMTADLHVDDIDEAVRRLTEAGADVDEVQSWDGGRHTLFRDLDGISWELLSP